MFFFIKGNNISYKIDFCVLCIVFDENVLYKFFGCRSCIFFYFGFGRWGFLDKYYDVLSGN